MGYLDRQQKRPGPTGSDLRPQLRCAWDHRGYAAGGDAPAAQRPVEFPAICVLRLFLGLREASYIWPTCHSVAHLEDPHPSPRIVTPWGRTDSRALAPAIQRGVCPCLNWRL